MGKYVVRLAMWGWWLFGTIYLLPLGSIFALAKKIHIKESKRLLKILTLWKHDAFPVPWK